MGTRWRLNRAGIINVYQYSNETLEFAGGRLLLRGVNGSGKSTAMNMLLPFLIDADTRRIDAAGEQTSVLRSWMLSGRDEPQPVGYLWIEFERAGEYLVCGCGIRATRSTDRVSTWWFVTHRRPGIDLDLVEQRVPIAADALRVTLGPGAVFNHDDRNAYRMEVRSRLFGGADIEQHIRLLNVVRSPRVGDRIDADLPAYLIDALPQLSDLALDDAAQPLEDLEEHRRNVEDLTRTADSLDALRSIYESYVRADVRRRAGLLLERVDDVRRHRRAERSQRYEADAAATALRDATGRIDDLAADERRLREEIEALQSSPAYQQGQELVDLRDHVATLAEHADRAGQELARTTDARSTAGRHLAEAERRFRGDISHLGVTLDDIGGLVPRARMAVRVPDLPPIATTAGDDELVVPVGALDLTGLVAALGLVRVTAHLREGDVGEVIDARQLADHRAVEMAHAERERDRAAADVATGEERFFEARRSVDAAIDQWRSAIRDWTDDLDSLDPGLAVSNLDARPADGVDAATRRFEVLNALRTAVDRLADHRRDLVAALAARRAAQAEEVGQLSAVLADLEARTHPDPPSAHWQRAGRRTCLADLIDFAPGVGETERRGLEAAMEAAGLLGAEIGDGGLQLESGELVAVAATQVSSPLSEFLIVAWPSGFDGDVETPAVESILSGISTSFESEANTVVTTEGRFRMGVLLGHHEKPRVEHIGAAARRAALERRRSELADAIRDGNVAIAETDGAVASGRDAIAMVVGLRERLPRVDAMNVALDRAELADQELDRTRHRLDVTDAAVRVADETYAEAVTALGRLAATHRLPADADGLRAVTDALVELIAICDRATSNVAMVERSHGDWAVRAETMSVAGRQMAAADTSLRLAREEHRMRSSRLATLEDTVGIEYSEVTAALDLSRSDLVQTTAQVARVRADRDDALRRSERAKALLDQATAALVEVERTCVGGIAPLRRALAIPGLLDAALGDESPGALPVVEETADGVRRLADSVLRLVPEPERLAVGADSVRQSLRQRRDQLGAGWDAEDHQPDESLPLAVQVNGPMGRMPLADAATRVRTQRNQQAGLLTAKQDQALRNLLQGLVAREVAEKMHAANELVALMNLRLDQVVTAHGIGVKLRWKRRGDLDDDVGRSVELLATPPDLRTVDQDRDLTAALSARIEQARRSDPDRRYRDLIADVLDYRLWHEMVVLLRRSGEPDAQLNRRTPLSEGEKKMVSYLPLFATVAASYDAIAESAPDAPRFLVLDDAFAKVSEDNHAQLFGLLVELDLDFIATSERLWGTHVTVPELAIVEVLRDAELGVIVLEHSRWNGHTRSNPR